MKPTKYASPSPSPLKRCICQCGCSVEFQSTRKNQIYLNKQHADYGYNHQKRKPRDAEKIKHVKILTKNDRIIAKHFLANIRRDETATVYFDVLRADGYDFSIHVGMVEEEGREYFFTFQYFIRIYPSEPKQVKIFRR
jgi:hypothetical protein